MLEAKERQSGNSHIFILATAVYKVLPYNESKTVAMIIPAKRLELDVLSYHIEAHILEHCKLVNDSLVARMCEKSITPIALIEKTVKEIRLAVEKQTRDAVLALSNSKGTNAKIRLYLISAIRAYLKIIELWILGRPYFKIILYFN